MKVKKSISQRIEPNKDLQSMMETFRQMINRCIRIGLKYNCSTLKKLSLLSYHELQDYDVMGSYKINAISQAAGRLAQMKQSIRRGIKTKQPFVKKPYLTNCYGFKINGCLISIPYKPRQAITLLLNDHTTKILSDPALKVCSFTLTAFNISLCVSKEIDRIECTKIVGIDRNLRNVTCGNHEQVTFYNTRKLLSIKQNTIHARAGFRRNDKRKRKQFYKRQKQRLQKRTRQFLHKISKDIVQNAKKTRSAIAFENMKGIRKLYKKGNGQGKKFRGRMNNGWPFYELQRQVQYKAAWEGIPVKFIDPKRTSKLCPVCGKRIQEDRLNRRKLLCTNCGKSMDRDAVASMNIARKAWPRFSHARGLPVEAQSSAFEEAMSEPRSSYDDLVIRIVDGSKLLLVDANR